MLQASGKGHTERRNMKREGQESVCIGLVNDGVIFQHRDSDGQLIDSITSNH